MLWNRLSRRGRPTVFFRTDIEEPDMGFGSYDESEQKDQNANLDDDEAVTVRENDHEGEVSFESEASQQELIDRLGEMKDDGEDDEE